MKKKILCVILAMFMLISALPLSVFADALEGSSDSSGTTDSNSNLPVVSVESLYSYSKSDDYPEHFFRALPGDDGVFYFDIVLDRAPETNEDIFVYYRTIDDSAVAAWGDYESVGAYEEAYVTLNAANGYRARVTVKSTVLDYATLGADFNWNITNNDIFSRRFIFELTRVEGNAVLYQPTSDSKKIKDRDKSRLYCYLKAERYLLQDMHGLPRWTSHVSLTDHTINTSFIYYGGSTSGDLNYSFPSYLKDYLDTGKYELGISIIGLCKEDTWNNEGPATLDLYYTYQGKQQKALTLIVEGQFDESEFFGWEHAFDYVNGDYDDERYAKERGLEYDIDDFIDDNFYGFILYDNDGNVAYKVTKEESRSVSDLVSALRQAKFDGYVMNIARYQIDLSNTPVERNSINWLKMPSNFAYADSYSWTFSTSTQDWDDGRRLEDVMISLCVYEKQDLKIAEDEAEMQMIATNIDQMKAGDPLRLSVRFNQLANMSYSHSATINLKINGIYDVSLPLQNMSYDEGYLSYSMDTFVFEGALPRELQGVNITSLTDINLSFSSEQADFYSFLNDKRLLSKRIHDIRGVGRDMRTPVATVSQKSSDLWAKSKSLDIYINTEENLNSRFNDYATVYYQWSSSPELPNTYGSRVTFHTSKDKETFKTIIGTGSREMYLHIKTVSSYGKSSISDAVTATYDPTDENAEYTPFGPFKFDNAPPLLSGTDTSVIDSMRNRKISIAFPDDNGGSGLRDISLYYIKKNGEETLFQTFTPSDFVGDPKTLTHTISHQSVGACVDVNGNPILARETVSFYWVLTDNLGNSSGKTAEFNLVFDTNEYLDSEIKAVGPFNISEADNAARFEENTQKIVDLTYIYNYKRNNGKTFESYPSLNKAVYYAFAFTLKDGAFTNAEAGDTVDGGVYDVSIYYKGTRLNSDSYELVEDGEGSGVYVALIYSNLQSGRYDLQLTRSEGSSKRVSQIYSVYATNGEEDDTPIKEKVEFGTLLSNSVYQLSSEYPYFYYKDVNGAIQKVHYNNTKQPATFSSIAKAKEYVYFKELSDLYLVQLNAATASALISGTTGYLIAKGETAVPQAGQYWIRYKSDSWTPTSGDSSWVYYYYGSNPVLTEGALSQNLQAALNTVATRIVGYGKSVMLTDTSLLGSPTSDKMLDQYGMPYLAPGQLHITDELSAQTMCGNLWSPQIGFAGDKSIYKSNILVGVEGVEYPIVGNFELPGDSIFQYMTYEQFMGDTPSWLPMNLENGRAFINFFTSSGVYYIREISVDGVSVFAIYVDKEAPLVSFTHPDESGEMVEIPVDGVEILDIRTKELYIGSIAPTEYDRLSYVAVYKGLTLYDLVGVYTAEDLALAPIKLADGNYSIVVSDRSGNHYTVIAKVSSTPLECTIKETPDKSITLTCNRANNQILRYEVYLNGVLDTSPYKQEQSFEKAGIYTIYIQDIYGNEFSKEHIFTRDYPTVTWKYFGSDGKYHTYDSNDPSVNGFILTWVYDNQYKISTAVKTRFSFSGNYVYEFVGTAPEYTEALGAETTVTIEAGQSFTLKVYYKDHRDCYSIYSGVVDVTPPSINVTADVDVLKNGENSLFDEWVKGNVGDVISMKDLYYVLTEISSRTVSNGGSLSSDLIKINASDANDLSLVEVYLDGELIKTQDASSGFSQIVVNRWGKYRVVAKDSLGNVSEFTFTNGRPDDFDYFVDGSEKELPLHGYLNFESVGDQHVYTAVDYGKNDFNLNIKQNANVFLSLGVSGEAQKIYGFRIADGCVYPLAYKIVLDKNNSKVIELEAGDAILDMNAANFKINEEYLISQNGAYEIYASVGLDQAVSIKVYAPKDPSKVVSVSARIEVRGSNTSFVSAELSKKTSNIAFEGVGLQTSDDIRLNSGFFIDESLFESERIASISLYYSKLNDLDISKLNGKTNIYTSNREYDDEGFYLLIVQNLYGNEKVYRIAISRSFGITSSVTFGDGHKIYYSKDYEETLYSNNEITLDILDEDVTFAVTLNGAAYTRFVQKQEGTIKYLVFSDEGRYEIKLTDSYGNNITRTLEIDKSSYSVVDELLTGYNEKALRRDDGYTNQMLSINKTVYDNAGIYYLAIGYGENLTVLYDAFAEKTVATNDQAFLNAIGSLGDGVYQVICRNRYGAVVTKEIHYRGTPTLKLERTTRSKSEPEAYDLSQAIALGFWSNNTLSFSTDAKTYVFTINGSVTECPRTLVFENAGDFGSFEYQITYIDEYGFEYSFVAYLVRKNVTVDIPASITGTEIDGILNTKDDISIIFGENIYATYTRDKGEEIVYRSGDVLKKDGTYRFTVIDYAGNATTMTVKKDTAVEFAFVDTASGSVIQNGSVVNSNKIGFDVLNKDSAYIEKVIRNGVVQTDFTGSKFTEDGKWELLICDKLGNRSYFSFYIITRAQNGFAYTTPHEYRITEVWYDTGDGVKLSYMSFVNHTDSTSSFDFMENGKYTVVMTSAVTGLTSTFAFTVNTNAPDVSLVGCNNGETTINDVTLTGYQVGDRIMIYRATETGEELVETVEITSLATKIPTITEGGKYRIVVESEAGVQTELSLVRKHVMNTAGSVFIMVVIGLAVVGLFTGLVYRNKSKTDD